eukprot:gene9486-10476_t
MSSPNQSFSTKYINHRSPSYTVKNGLAPLDYRTTNSKMEPLIPDEIDQVQLHPLIIAQDTVVCMPEVNKVLRTVYQVLSQANYYLSKHGISSRRFSGAQLIKIKMLGILNHDAKVCSYILQHEAERIFDSFDITVSSRKSQKIIWMDPILLDDNADAMSGGRHSNSSHDKHINAPPVDVQVFELGTDSIVCAPDIQKVIQTHFNQGATTGYYFSKLGILPFKFIHAAHLDKVKELGIIKKSAVHCTYVSINDAKRVFEAYGMTEEDLKTKINWLPSINLDNLPWKSKWHQHSIKPEAISSPASNSSMNEADASYLGKSNGSEHPPDEEFDAQMEQSEEKPSLVHLFIVDNKEVVCMPDIHKIVQAVHGSSIQVNYYLNKLHVKKKRFCFAHLKELKTRGVLQGNATYCTYIPKIEAEKIFQIYSLMGDHGVEWTEPLRLDKLPGSCMASHGNGTSGVDADGQLIKGLKVPTFIVDGEEVLCTPDVHKIVDYLEEQSASLDYHFRKLGIVKRRYTYSQLHQLRRMQIIKRPTVCTYIRKLDVEQLLLMYATDRNKIKMQNIHWLKPVPLLSSEHGPQRATESPNSKPDVENSNHEHLHVGESPDADYAMSDLYKIYVGEKMSSDHEKNPNSPESPAGQRNQKEFASCSSAELQKANPHIDCPIVIPNADFDPSISSSSMNMPSLPSPAHPNLGNSFQEMSSAQKDDYNPLKRKHQENALKDFRGSKDDHVIVEKLLKDLHRKETELRHLHDAYQHAISVEKERRVQAEKELEKAKQQLALEKEQHGGLESRENTLDGESQVNNFKDIATEQA